MLGITSTCALERFRNSIALEKDEEHVIFVNMRLRVLLECPNQDEEVGMKHIENTKCFQLAPMSPSIH